MAHQGTHDSVEKLPPDGDEQPFVLSHGHDLSPASQAAQLSQDTQSEGDLSLSLQNRAIVWDGFLRAPVSRRTLLGTAATLGAYGLFRYAASRFGQVQQAENTLSNWLDEVVRGYPSNARLRAMAEACNGPGGPVIDLDVEQARSGIEGIIDIDWYSFGTSDPFGLGLDNGGSRFNQPNSSIQIGAQAISPEQRALLRIGTMTTGTFARPGSYSGLGNYPGYEVGAADCLLGTNQLQNPEFINRIRESPAIQVVRIEGGFDDFRILLSTIGQLVHGFANVVKLATSNTLTNDLQRSFTKMLAGIRVVAKEFGVHLIETGRILDEINTYREEHGLPRVNAEYAFTWDLTRQARFPLGPLDEKDAVSTNGILKPDRTGPAVLNRHFVDVDELPNGDGPKMVRIIWAEIFLAQVEALQVIRSRYPGLNIVTEQLMDINLLPDFYAALVPYESESATVDPKGDGHPGLVPGAIAGIQHVASADLATFRRGVNGQRVGLHLLAHSLQRNTA